METDAPSGASVAPPEVVTAFGPLTREVPATLVAEPTK